MRIASSSLIAALLLLVVTGGVAAAETLYTKGRTAIRARPGEQARIVVRVDSGEAVQVVERDGRWLKVEYQGEIGWVTRTSLRAKQETAKPNRQRRPRRDQRQERRKPANRPADGEAKSSFGRRSNDDDSMRMSVIAERARVFSKPDREADVVFTVEQGDELRATERGDGWFRVRGRNGKEGWIVEDALGDHAALERARASADTPESSRAGSRSARGNQPVDEAPDESAAEEPGPGAAISEIDEEEEEQDLAVAEPSVASARSYSLRAGIGAGATALSLDYASDPPASAAGLATGVALSGAIDYPIMSALSVGADVRYLAQLGVSGLSYEGGGGEVEGSSFMLYDLDAGARAGYAITEGIGAWLRVGYYYNSLYTRDLQNEAQLPREELAGPTAGLGVSAAIGSSIMTELSASALFAGTHRQTQGLEDGAELSGVSALWASLGVLYDLTDTYALELRYRFGRHATSWTGASSRAPGEQDASRTDLSHQVVTGISASF